ncbi:MAG: hypothetical protein MZW92_30465 [Comamonadaceae bacterium]|nr:hypothetical protein [Comamonadaceae bacterium]
MPTMPPTHAKPVVLVAGLQPPCSASTRSTSPAASTSTRCAWPAALPLVVPRAGRRRDRRAARPGRRRAADRLAVERAPVATSARRCTTPRCRWTPSATPGRCR